MASYLYSLERNATLDGANKCWHCKSDATFKAYTIVGASALGRFFLSLSSAVPLLVCDKCGKASQRLTTGGKLLVGLSWMPMTLMFGAGAVYFVRQAAEFPEAEGMAWLMVGATTLGAFIMGFMLWRILRLPLYPTAGQPIEVDGKTYLGRK